MIFPRVGMRRVLIADENRSHAVSEFVAAGAGQAVTATAASAFSSARTPEARCSAVRRDTAPSCARISPGTPRMFSLTQLV